MSFACLFSVFGEIRFNLVKRKWKQCLPVGPLRVSTGWWVIETVAPALVHALCFCRLTSGPLRQKHPQPIQYFPLEPNSLYTGTMAWQIKSCLKTQKQKNSVFFFFLLFCFTVLGGWSCGGILTLREGCFCLQEKLDPKQDLCCLKEQTELTSTSPECITTPP